MGVNGFILDFVEALCQLLAVEHDAVRMHFVFPKIGLELTASDRRNFWCNMNLVLFLKKLFI